MKTNLITTIVIAIFGVAAAYFVCDYLIGPIGSVSFTTVDTKVSSALEDPDPEIFNYRALNPTVEVYVGECKEYNEFGDCIETAKSTEPIATEDQETK